MRTIKFDSICPKNPNSAQLNTNIAFAGVNGGIVSVDVLGNGSDIDAVVKEANVNNDVTARGDNISVATFGSGHVKNADSVYADNTAVAKVNKSSDDKINVARVDEIFATNAGNMSVANVGDISDVTDYVKSSLIVFFT